MSVKENFELAKKQYEQWGVNVEEALEKLKNIPISIHCWQGDDIAGFEVNQRELSGESNESGGIKKRFREGALTYSWKTSRESPCYLCRNQWASRRKR